MRYRICPGPIRFLVASPPLPSLFGAFEEDSFKKPEERACLRLRLRRRRRRRRHAFLPILNRRRRVVSSPCGLRARTRRLVVYLSTDNTACLGIGISREVFKVTCDCQV